MMMTKDGFFHFEIMIVFLLVWSLLVLMVSGVYVLV